MQISSINAMAFKGNYQTNAQKIEKLEQKHAAIQYATEGCNGSLSARDQFELDARKELQILRNEHAAAQWATEGCNGSLSAEKMARMEELEKLVKEFDEEETCNCPACTNERKIYDMPLVSIYEGVPASTFYGDWAR